MDPGECRRPAQGRRDRRARDVPARSPPRSSDSPCHSTASGAWMLTSRLAGLGGLAIRSSASRPTKSTAFRRETAKPSPDRERIVSGPHVVAPRAEAAFHPRGIEGEGARVAQPEVDAAANDLLVASATAVAGTDSSQPELPGE